MLVTQTSGEMAPLFVVIWRQASFFILFMSPSINYLVFYTVVFLVNTAQFTLRHFGSDDPQANQLMRESVENGFGCVLLFWILQKRELRNFFTQLDAQQREEQAVKKQRQTSNVLDLQRDSIVIVSNSNEPVLNSTGLRQDNTGTGTGDVAVPFQLAFEYANSKSSELLGISLAEFQPPHNNELYRMAILEQLSKPKFIALQKTEVELYEPDPIEEMWKLNAIRGIMNSDGSSGGGSTIAARHCLISLEDIIKRKESLNQQATEAYTLVDSHLQSSRDTNRMGKAHDSTLIVKRAKLIFNDKECIVLSFQDITALKLLKSEEQKTKFMSNLYSCVQHEITGPLKINEESATRLIQKLTDPHLINLARISLLCTKQVLLRANDLLDQKQLENGSFSPTYSPDSVPRAIKEIVTIISMSINHRSLQIILDVNQLQSLPQNLSFDARRLQQVLYNLLSNAIKFTRQGMITVQAKVISGSCGALLQVSVKDTGIGIPEDQLPKIFDGISLNKNPMSKKLNPYGNGIGLLFCKKVCQSLDGDISVQSHIGLGSTFKFTMRCMHVVSGSSIDYETSQIP